MAPLLNTEEFKNIVSGRVVFDEPLDCHTSIGVGGKADALVFPKDVKELGRITAYLNSHHIPYCAVGNWTNIIVKDNGYRGVIISLKYMRYFRWNIETDGKVFLYAQAGVKLSDMIALCMKEGFTGMEFCAGIPGSVGGAVKMNAGAYGKEIKDILETITLIDARGHAHEASRDSLRFTYRDLDLPEETVIADALFLLRKNSREEIVKRIREIMNQRKTRHPLEYPNAGSIFKNPKGSPAGEIIEAVGLKGARIGDAEISERHGNFIINLGHAKASDILELIGMVKDKVWREKSISLETEVKIIGD
jgi:UDP-N-acetylmuramate dehydrogenase